MPRFAEIKISTNTVIRTFFQDVQPPDIPGKDVKFLPATTVNPPYNPATQNKTGPAWVITATEAQETWTVTNKTAQQLDDEKTAQVDGMEFAVLQVLFRHENLNRQLIRALRATSTAANNAANNAGLPTTANSQDVTVAQFKTFVKSLIP